MLPHWYGIALTAIFLTAVPGYAEPPADLDCADDERLLQAARLGTDGPALLKFFQHRTASDEVRQQIPRFIEQLDSNRFSSRQQASDRLIAIGPAALPALRRAGKGRSLEMTQRVERCIREIETPARLGLTGAAARLLKARQPYGSAAVLLDYLPLLDNDEDAEESILEALLTLGVRKETVVPVMVGALEDKDPARRAAAALVAGRSGGAEQRTRVRSILADANMKVRLRAAQGLLSARDPVAIPALIALLAEETPLALEAEDLLCRAAGDGAPKIEWRKADKTRRKCQAAWEKWWQANGDHPGLGCADLDMPVVNVGRRAKQVSERWLLAYRKNDRAAHVRLTEAPFYFAGKLLTREELDKEFAGESDEKKYLNKKVFRSEDFSRRTDEATRQFLGKYGRSELRAVYVEREGNEGDNGVLIVRVRGGQAKIIGVSQITEEPAKK